MSDFAKRRCEGCGTDLLHADDCPALDAQEQELPCLRSGPHPPHKHMLNRTTRQCPGVPGGSSDLYFCPTVGEIESTGGGGFKNGTCCAHPELHTYLGYSTPGIEAISQYLSDKVREQYAAGPDLSDWQSPEDAVYDALPVHPGQNDPTTINWVSDADEAKAELLRLQKVARYYRDRHQHLDGHPWAETIHTDNNGCLRIPVYAEDGQEEEAVIVRTRADAVTLHDMIGSYIGGCPTECDEDCEGICHEAHQPPWKRHHPIGEHQEEK